MSPRSQKSQAFFAAITAALAYGMWTLRNRARIVTIIITAVSLIGTLPGLAALFSNFMAQLSLVKRSFLAMDEEDHLTVIS